MASKEKYALGVDIGGTNIKVGIISESGKIVRKTSVETLRKGGPKTVVTQIKKGIEEILYDNNLKLHGIGIGAAGTVNPWKGTVENPPNVPGWNKVQLGKIIENKFGFKLCLDNDANAAALGEMLFGAGKKLNSFVMVTLGTGVGGGIIMNRKLYHGDFSAAGEIGHVIVNYDGPRCNCGSYGCVEAYVGNHYLCNRVRKEIKDHPKSIVWEMIDEDVKNISPRVVAEAADSGDKYARSVVVQTGEYLGYALASTANLIDIGTFIIGGGVAGFGKLLIDAAQKTATKRVLTPIKKRIKVLPAKLKNDAGIKGASALVFYKSS